MKKSSCFSDSPNTAETGNMEAYSFATTPGWDEDEKSPRTMIQQFEDVIDQMEDDVKKYYYIARETIPELVATETDPHKFLLAASGDVKSAAERLATYWMNRHYFFGDRWLLPMTQTGTGCLSREDVENLRSGYITLVTLEDGRQLYVTDATRLENQVGFGVRERLSYYFATAGLNERSHREGVDSAILVGPRGLANDERFTENLKRLYTSLPVLPKSMVTVPIPFTTAGREHLIEFFSFMLVKSNETMSPATLAGTIIPSSTAHALERLEGIGIHRMHLPEKVGGSPYFNEKFSEWIRMRLSIEDAMSGVLPLQNLLPTLGGPARPDRSNKGLSEIIRRPSGAKFDKNAKEEYTKKRNAMYARRRTQKFKIQQVLLQDQVDSLCAENKRLAGDNKKLELLLARANMEISFSTLACTDYGTSTLDPI
uniref:BZIP domain-containing protein n=1 Tax=Amphora coffeiformis TaxID=265554 RepID=A0A7S3L648_9STRA